DAGDGDLAARLRVAVADDETAQDVGARVLVVPVAAGRVLGVELVALRRALHVRDRGQRRVVDADPLGGAPGLLGRVGGDDRDGLAEVADAVDREHGLVGELEAVALLAGHVGVREHRVHAGHRERLGEVEREDTRVRVRTAQGVTPEHAGRDEVARVRKIALHLRHAVDARHGLPDPPELEPPPRRLVRALRHWPLDTMRVLDVGCSYGHCLVHFGPGSVGIDNVPEHVEFCRMLGLDAQLGDVESGLDRLADESFEAVWVSDILEHLDAPRLLLRRLAPKLAPGGLLVLYLTVLPRSRLARAVFRGRGFFDADVHHYQFTVE